MRLSGETRAFSPLPSTSDDHYTISLNDSMFSASQPPNEDPRLQQQQQQQDQHPQPPPEPIVHMETQHQHSEPQTPPEPPETLQLLQPTEPPEPPEPPKPKTPSSPPEQIPIPDSSEAIPTNDDSDCEIIGVAAPRHATHPDECLVVEVDSTVEGYNSERRLRGRTVPAKRRHSADVCQVDDTSGSSYEPDRLSEEDDEDDEGMPCAFRLLGHLFGTLKRSRGVNLNRRRRRRSNSDQIIDTVDLSVDTFKPTPVVNEVIVIDSDASFNSGASSSSTRVASAASSSSDVNGDSCASSSRVNEVSSSSVRGSTLATAPASTPEPEKNLTMCPDCPICRYNFSESRPIASTFCGHIFCTPCVKVVMRTNRKCPSCRKQLKGKGYHQLFF